MPHAAFYVVQPTGNRLIVMPIGFQCRTQHFMWCNMNFGKALEAAKVSMPHAAFYVVQLIRRRLEWLREKVSMPHAAFYVVQLGMIAWCAVIFACFNAARSILCGATPSLAALVPRGARGRFGKSSIFCAVSPLWGGIFTEKTRHQSASSLVRRGLRQNGKSRR